MPLGGSWKRRKVYTLESPLTGGRTRQKRSITGAQRSVTGRTEEDPHRKSMPPARVSSLKCASAGMGKGLVMGLRVQGTDSGRGLLLAVRRQLKGLECGTAASRGVCQRSPGPTTEAKLHH